MLKNFKTFELSVKFYRECEKLRLPVHLKNQLSKASSSVSLNLAEGSGKPTNKDQLRFYYYCNGQSSRMSVYFGLSSFREKHLIQNCRFIRCFSLPPHPIQNTIN